MIKRPTSSLYKEEKAGRRERKFFCFTHCLSSLTGIRDPNTDAHHVRA
jgi:hypothetical protein